MEHSVNKLLKKCLHTYTENDKMADDVNEGTEKALNVIVSTMGSSGNMKKELKTVLFDTVSTLRKLFLKLLDNNESNTRKITELEQKVAKTNALRDKAREEHMTT